MKTFLIIVLVLIAVAMIYLGITTQMLPPALTGLGFLVIAYLLKTK